MCDRCYYKDKFTPSAKEISNYCNELYQIIDKADGMEIKLTGLKLIDAWFVGQVFCFFLKLCLFNSFILGTTKDWFQ